MPLHGFLHVIILHFNELFHIVNECNYTKKMQQQLSDKELAVVSPEYSIRLKILLD